MPRDPFKWHCITFKSIVLLFSPSTWFIASLTYTHSPYEMLVPNKACYLINKFSHTKRHMHACTIIIYLIYTPCKTTRLASRKIYGNYLEHFTFQSLVLWLPICTEQPTVPHTHQLNIFKPQKFNSRTANYYQRLPPWDPACHCHISEGQYCNLLLCLGMPLTHCSDCVFSMY